MTEEPNFELRIVRRRDGWYVVGEDGRVYGGPHSTHEDAEMAANCAAYRMEQGWPA